MNKQNVVYEFKCDLCDAKYRLHVRSPPSACRGTQTFRYWKAFLGKTQLKKDES